MGTLMPSGTGQWVWNGGTMAWEKTVGAVGAAGAAEGGSFSVADANPKTGAAGKFLVYSVDGKAAAFIEMTAVTG